jgi:glycosyltransferase involved in cell wall biosynthesis
MPPEGSSESPTPRILIVVNVGWFFLSHQLPIALAAMVAGCDVHVACGLDDPAEAAEIKRRGLVFHHLDVRRAGRSPVGEVKLFGQLLRLYRQLAPDVIHHVTIKPVIYGSLAARLVTQGKVVNTISGLGYVFMASGVGAQLVRTIVRCAYRLALAGPRTTTIFQNLDDRAAFIDARMVAAQQAVLIQGSGVDLDAFRPTAEAAGPVTVVLPARMLRDKGVFEFLDAATLLRNRGVKARFLLAGGIDRANPAAITEAELKEAAECAGVKWLGYCTAMPELYAACHIVCLPSYREGLPKALLEATAAGRPIVTTDVPGCREAVIDGVTGVLVPPRDGRALAEALRRLIEDADLRARMGKAARKFCEAHFGTRTVVRETLTLYGLKDTAPGWSRDGSAPEDG